MFNASESTLKEALVFNYWSIQEGLRYLTNVEKHDRPETERERWRRRQNVLVELWNDTDHTQPPRSSSGRGRTEFPVAYFIQWASRKNISIPWLQWAIEQGLLPSDIGSKNLVCAKQSQGQPADTLSPRKERSYLFIIAALLNKLEIDWTNRKANLKIRQLVEEIGEELSDDAVRKVLNDLKKDEQINFILQALRNKIDPP